MKKIILSLFVAAMSFSANAQIKTPAPSPFQKIEQIVGLTDVTVEYSRPGVKGRKIFGGLEDYGKVWRTGANQNTKVTFSTDVTVAGTKVKKGTYALYTIPGEKTWDIMLYADATNWGNPAKWDESKVVVKVNVPVIEIPMIIETLTISFDDLTNNSAVLGIMWENTYVGLEFETPTDAMVSAEIEKIMQGPSADDYYAAAAYNLSAGKDIEKAKTWIDKAVEMTADAPKFWFLRRQSLIYAKAGDKSGAIKAAKESLKYAKKANNGGYIKMNTASLKEWGAM
ncbi:dihydrolipoamide dehydrogenase [Polaribacter reichenbachii]|uniref:Dihydrolipoamide dehydrogenase n=1 Tax=Polaribacter reichenbachii TaxID=996801 RepID=A0A1B8U3Z2_9FLAO|nr:DUF2911 domain-containing protein [Polaribacter reichenbachii]APZ47893.1 dihydrolipoamide dehydrogenase [Polaribacter reichenbachii]AUC18527.1 dihydrolipoamide dehydrogenase [Polaribacter reichenbachii]OBY66595.1 dihydrolipoamide dehydrogenase [Polaribacter reichenbachii]